MQTNVKHVNFNSLNSKTEVADFILRVNGKLAQCRIIGICSTYESDLVHVHGIRNNRIASHLAFCY